MLLLKPNDMPERYLDSEVGNYCRWDWDWGCNLGWGRVDCCTLGWEVGLAHWEHCSNLDFGAEGLKMMGSNTGVRVVDKGLVSVRVHASELVLNN